MHVQSVCVHVYKVYVVIVSERKKNTIALLQKPVDVATFNVIFNNPYVVKFTAVPVEYLRFSSIGRPRQTSFSSLGPPLSAGLSHRLGHPLDPTSAHRLRSSCSLSAWAGVCED